ncbi:MAG: EamA family transporter, partial [Anaerolineales bacterium]|nr:EamA family transporter [Anaerolineales bacterium]
PRPGTIPLTPYPHRALLLAVLGGALFASDLVFWNSGVLLSGATMPTLMGNTAPVWVGLGALVFFREKLTLSFWLGLLLAISGAVVILGLNLRQDFNLGLGT